MSKNIQWCALLSGKNVIATEHKTFNAKKAFTRVVDCGNSLNKIGWNKKQVTYSVRSVFFI